MATMTLRRLLKDCRGNVTPMFALAVIPIFGLIGAAVDYSRANSVRTAMQAAADATALMLSKESYLNDGVAGPWRPHIMPFVAKDKLATWAAGYKGSPIISPATATFRSYEPVTVVILAPFWSDGSPAPPLK